MRCCYVQNDVDVVDALEQARALEISKFEPFSVMRSYEKRSKSKSNVYSYYYLPIGRNNK